jgi:hypothetical protein
MVSDWFRKCTVERDTTMFLNVVFIIMAALRAYTLHKPVAIRQKTWLVAAHPEPAIDP